MTKIWAGAIKDADMERYLEIRITESGKVGEVLRAEAGLTKRQISQAKFRPGGILKNGKQCRVTEIAVPGDRLQVCLEAKGIDSKQLVCPDTSSFIERGKKQLLDFERQELEDGLKPQKLQILYEDQDLLVVNKPAGMVTHPSGSHYQDSISNLLAAYFREKNETTRIRSIGRLDKETSGILLFARNQVAAARLQKQREEGKLQKKYLALAEGDLSEANDSVFWKEIAIPLAPDPENPMKMTISPDGLLPGSRNAVTYYKNIKSFGNVTLVELQLETGRTHQIRVHMSGIGHPLLGDTMYNPRVCLKNHSHNLHAPLCGRFCLNSVTVARYGALIRAKSPTNCDAHLAESLFQTRSGACLKMSNSKEKKNTKGRINNRNDCFKRAALHAWKLTFCHPFTDEIITLEAPLPDDFCRFLNANEEEKT